MYIVCSDMEGVFTPEIWISVAERTGIEELRLTTRDIADYDVLMRRRLSILDEHRISLNDITDVIDTMEPLEGAVAFLDWLRDRVALIVVSDTYAQFAAPLIRKLGRPTLFCHTLSVNGDGRITGYNLRQSDAKRRTVEALRSLNYKVIGMGDSYNDVNMLKAAHHGILFRPPQNVIDEFPQFPVTTDYDELKPIIEDILGSDP
ncbi:MAG TPA: bifunctional phosphoserine phosphatase/homoserine phosphotransferase ThrH [Desulfobacteraceae bacterium]|nr:bifunctional phosphoserine phosphatase/homoserine phosphotransferase ThrH [Deltaproteobacteria bacterium]MBW2355895.1 bifunctional phosphoserine phosphatase/homoserine phosphotransferase ThrH [Deltaproteobacteria bacterium]HDI61204.1 bifunctional phosphoserine phosphatase/homoserine phosphotransferase ThrH [Desulfobacteraceae bacterium]